MSCQSPQGLKVFRMDPQSNTCFIIGFNMSSQLSRSGLIQAAGSPEKTVKWWSSSLTRGVVSGICLIFSPSWSRSRLAITQHSGFAGRWLSMDMGRAGQGGPSMWSCTWHLGVGSVGPKKIYVQYYHIWQEMGSSLGWIRCPLPPKKCAQRIAFGYLNRPPPFILKLFEPLGKLLRHDEILNFSVQWYTGTYANILATSRTWKFILGSIFICSADRLLLHG